jgi:bla regulator protein blaR1
VPIILALTIYPQLNCRAIVIAALTVACSLPFHAQVLNPATGPLPAFDITVIKPSKELPHGADTEGEQTRFIVNTKLLIQMAYGVSTSTVRGADIQVLNGPDWINDSVFDILTKIDPATFTAMQSMNRSQRSQRRQLMEQSLLADRFKLKLHTETRDQPVYALTLSKGPRPKLSANLPAVAATVLLSPGGSDAIRPEDLQHGIVVVRRGQFLEMTVKAMTIGAFVRAIATFPELGGRAVVDQTNLAGTYDFNLDWSPEQLTPASPSPDAAIPPSPDSDSDARPLFTAIQQQLGLKLVPSKGPAQVLVIDHIEKPSIDY